MSVNFGIAVFPFQFSHKFVDRGFLRFGARVLSLLVPVLDRTRRATADIANAYGVVVVVTGVATSHILRAAPHYRSVTLDDVVIADVVLLFRVGVDIV